jgi:hypothetical protein
MSWSCSASYAPGFRGVAGKMEDESEGIGDLSGQLDVVPAGRSRAPLG